jgi:hypothetical protein
MEEEEEKLDWDANPDSLASKPNELKKLLWPISNTQKSRVNSQ